MSKPEALAVGAIFFAVVIVFMALAGVCAVMNVVADALVAAGKYLRAMKQQSEFDFKVDA